MSNHRALGRAGFRIGAHKKAPVSGFRFLGFISNLAALLITETVLGAPYYSYSHSRKPPKTLF